MILVLARRDNVLFVNDGRRGLLGRAIGHDWRHSPRLLRDVHMGSDEQEGFSFCGPSYGNEDYMPGPFLLPSSVDTGDWILVELVGSDTLSFQPCGSNGSPSFRHLVAEELEKEQYHAKVLACARSVNTRYCSEPSWESFSGTGL